MNLLQRSIAGAIMILVIIVIRALTIHQLPKKTFFVLWEIVLVRLLIPFSFPTSFSVYSLINNHIFAIEPGKNSQVIIPMEQIGAMLDSLSNTTLAVSIWTIRMIIWIAGMLVCMMIFAVTYWKCYQHFRVSLPVDNNFTREWLNTHRLKRPISIRQSNRFSTPLTYGIFRPVILMPTSTKWEDRKLLQYVFTHEYIHIRRFDIIVKFVLIVTLCIHWFNPLVWVLYILANRDIELSCDEAVIRYFGESTKAAYARTLIRMEEIQSGFVPLCNNFGKTAIEERIVSIMKYKKASIFSLVLALTLIACVATGFATSAVATVTDDANDINTIPSESSSTIQNDITLALDNSELEVVPPNVIGIADYRISIGKEEDLNGPVTTQSTTLISVSHDDERKFTPERWKQILEMIEEGKVFWED